MVRSRRTLIIAEAGVNHNGNLKIAKKLINVAADAGADMVKFQTFTPERIVSRFAEKAEYQKKSTGNDDSQLEMLRKLVLKKEWHPVLKEHAEKRGIKFISTPFDFDSIDFLKELDLPLFKIPSGEITNLPYLERIGQIGKPVILSTGMSSMDEIEKAVSILRESGCGEISVLHCNTQYPTPYKDVNLEAMDTIRRRLNVPVGYSDHTSGIEVPIAAVAMGAEIIEKHYTLDKDMEGPDNKASLDPCELKEMIRAIRNIEDAIGDGEKSLTPSEMNNLKVVRKSIVAAKPIKSGDVLTEDNITVKRPGIGLSPMMWYDVIGTNAIRDLDEDEFIEI